VPVAILAALAAGAVWAPFTASSSRGGRALFVVTLSGLIGWQGLQLYVLGKEGTINSALRGWHRGPHAHLLPAPVGYAIGAAVVVLYLFLDIASTRRRVKSGLPSRPISESIVRAVLLAVALFVTIYVLKQARACPLALLIFVGFIAAFDWILRRTR